MWYVYTIFDLLNTIIFSIVNTDSLIRITHSLLQRNLSHRWLAYESSPIDWCEDNYRVNPYVAEFVNTISNMLLVIFPLFVIRSNIWSSYLQYVSVGPHITLYLMSLTGLGSLYFHCTLSFMGQFLDEIAQLWACLIAYAFFYPARYQA